GKSRRAEGQWLRVSHEGDRCRLPASVRRGKSTILEDCAPSRQSFLSHRRLPEAPAAGCTPPPGTGSRGSFEPAWPGFPGGGRPSCCRCPCWPSDPAQRPPIWRSATQGDGYHKRRSHGLQEECCCCRSSVRCPGPAVHEYRNYRSASEPASAE